MITREGRRYGFEIKRTASPRITPSMRSALEDLTNQIVCDNLDRSRATDAFLKGIPGGSLHMMRQGIESTEGESFLFTLTFPVPSIPLQ